ncbi:metalloenzyme domain-containing protein [Thermus islandicus]|uniref:metalloenzyme domain-containing protein n=1 Tax=Thermus islandicus TaxID=540988 RepID=UPI0003B55A27|nr:metalloenzyme domain-containing protein [Thermus islandicus]
MLFLFVDGLGLGGALEDLFPFLLELHPQPVDATLGVEGLPQSGTGQTALLTGENAARLLGRHQGPFPSPSLRPLLARSLYAWARRQGLSVLHANAYRHEYLEQATRERRLFLSAFAQAARLSGLPLLPQGHPLALPPGFWEDPYGAGARAADLARRFHLVVLEYWALDLAAHRQPGTLPERFTELTGFLRGFLAEGGELCLTSDHGNAEEPWHPRHTRNPVPLVYTGSPLPPPADLTGVFPWLQVILASKLSKSDRNT